MSKVTDIFKNKTHSPVTICDVSPPRGTGIEFLEEIEHLDVDGISVAYNPGKSVRIDSAVLSYAIKEHTGKDVVFNLATRDMNKLAIQSHLLGAAMLGLENVVVLKGDNFSDKDMLITKDVNDFKPTELIHHIKNMNLGLDYRSRKLNAATDFCVGATMDLNRGIEVEASLTYSKVCHGADFFIAQPVFDTGEIERFLDTYESLARVKLNVPVFYGLQILARDSVVFNSVPDEILHDLEVGKDGVDLALAQWNQLMEIGVDGIYLVPPIQKGGLRDYRAAERLLERVL